MEVSNLPSRMNSAVVIFLDDIDKANQLIENGVVIQGTFIPVLSLVNPAKRLSFLMFLLFLKIKFWLKSYRDTDIWCL